MPGFKRKSVEMDPRKRFKMEECLGKGAFASIYKTLDLNTKKYCAIKKLGKNSKGKLPMDEYDLAKNLKHPNIVKTIDCVCTSDHMYLQLELCNGGDLFTQLDPSGNGLDENLARKLMGQLATGMAYLHANDIIHCDIKPENILLHNGVLKICDLGLAGPNGQERTGRSKGTGAYMAPELINRTATPYKITPAQDVWSFAIVLYAVLFADLPWEKAKLRDPDFALFCKLGGVSSKIHPFHFCSPTMRQFLRMILAFDPAKRPTMTNVAEFFKRKVPWYIDTKSNLHISFGMKENKGRARTPDVCDEHGSKEMKHVNKTTKSPSSTRSGKSMPAKDAHSSCSSIPSMIDETNDQINFALNGLKV